MSTELMKRETLEELCQKYAAAVEETRQAFDLLKSAKARMESSFGSMHAHLWMQAISDYNLTREQTNVRKTLTRNFWRCMVDRSGVLAVMGEKKRNALYSAMENDELPPVDVETVLSMLKGMYASAPDLMKEAVLEAAQRLRPYTQEYKTNKDGWQLGERAIINHAVENWYGEDIRLNYRFAGDLASIDNAFRMLDGKGPAKYAANCAPGEVPATPLEGLLDAAMRRGERSLVTEYFEIKWFKKGSMHFKFRRMDLVAKLNALATGNVLRKEPAVV